MKDSSGIIKSSTQTEELERYLETPGSPYQGYGSEPPEGDREWHLRDYLRSVQKRLPLIIAITLLICLIAAVYIARKPNVFEARARVQVDLEGTTPSVGRNNAGAGSLVVNNPVNDPAYFNTQLQILTSPGLLRRVVRTLDLENDKNFLHPESARTASAWQNALQSVGLGEKKVVDVAPVVEEAAGRPEVAPASAQNDLIEAKRLAPYVAALEEGLKVEPVKENRLMNKETRLIDIRFKHSEPEIAAKVVNAIADVFALSNYEKKAENNSTAGEFLQKRVAELQEKIRNSEERLINYSQNNQIISLDPNQNMVLERLIGLNRQLLEAENERKQAEAAYRAALAPGAASALAESSNKEPADAEAKLAELRQRRAQLLVESMEEWPEVKEVEQQIAVLEKYLQETRNRAVGTVVTNLETRYRQGIAREEALRAAFNEQRSETLVQNEAAINYRIIQQEIETNRSLLDGLLQKSKENDVLLVGMPNNVRVLDYALAPDEPIAPRRLQSFLVASAFALACALGLALFLEYFDNTFSSPDEVEKFLRLPALAVIPAIKAPMRERLLTGMRALQPGHHVNGDGKTGLLINADPSSSLAEAYRHLRTSVTLNTTGRAPKTLLVTSSLPAEGKTTTAVNTAVSMAMTGARVLLIDADLRHPRLHTIFERSNERGLSTLLSKQMSTDQALELIETDAVSGLGLLSSGPVPDNPAELLGSEQMPKILTALTANFDYILIDSPPIATFTDGVLLSSMVDGVLLVVHSGKSSGDVVRRSQKMLYDIGSRIFGIVLNQVTQRRSGHYLPYYHQRYYKTQRRSAGRLA